MKLLLCHNYYQQRGGEDESFEAEAELLSRHGHEVIRYTRHNDEIKGRTQLSIAGQTLWSRSAQRELRELIEREKPAVMMCTNIFPMLSPSIYVTAHRMGVAVIQQLRNYRAFCVNGLFLREQEVCQDCLGKAFAWKGVRYGCYRESRLASLVVAGWQQTFRYAALARGNVDLFLTPSRYTRDQFVAGGFDADRVMVRPNVTSRVAGSTPSAGGGFALYAGRLSEEKGIGTVCEAWEVLAKEGISLRVIGDGPEAPRVQRSAERGELTWLGRLPREQTQAMMAEASVVIVPSICPETFGRAAVEAYAAGTPVIVADIGGLPEVVEDGQTGYRFKPGDAVDLASIVRRFYDQPSLAGRMGLAAQALYESMYTSDRIYAQMLTIFERAMELARVLG